MNAKLNVALKLTIKNEYNSTYRFCSFVMTVANNSCSKDTWSKTEADKKVTRLQTFFRMQGLENVVDQNKVTFSEVRTYFLLRFIH